MHYRFRRDRKHDHRRYGEGAKGHGATVDNHGDQHHRGHKKRALRRDFSAGQQ